MKAPLASLRGRLALGFAAMLFVGLLVFAAIAVAAIDEDLWSTLDARLATQAEAAATFIDVRNGRVAIDADDRPQFLAVLGVQSEGIVLGTRGTPVLSTTEQIPAGIAGAMMPPGVVSLGGGENTVRAYVRPIASGGRRIATVVIWRDSAWIGETIVRTAVAFATGALVIALIAWWAGSAMADRVLGDAFERQRRFTADASHELRAPLAVIRAEADLALRRERDAASYRASFTTVAQEADRMERLIGELLSAARAESGALVDEPIDLRAVVERVRDRLLPAAQARRGEITLSAPGEAIAYGDASALERALTAIVHNAVKHMRDGGCVALRIRPSASGIDLVVDDDGPGFTSQALLHGTERFWRGEAARDDAGTGLGLAIASAIIQALRGSLALANRIEGGAQVRVHLPLGEP